MSVPGADPHSHVVDALREGQPVEAQYVRQGRRNMRILWVLAVSLALAAIVTLGLWLFHAAQATPNINTHPRAPAYGPNQLPVA